MSERRCHACSRDVGGVLFKLFGHKCCCELVPSWAYRVGKPLPEDEYETPSRLNLGYLIGELQLWILWGVEEHNDWVELRRDRRCS